MLWNSPLHPGVMPLPTGSIGNAPRLVIQILKSPGYIKALSLFIKQCSDPARVEEAFIGLATSIPAAGDKDGLSLILFLSRHNCCIKEGLQM